MTAKTPKNGRIETLYWRPDMLRLDVKFHENDHNVLWFVDGVAKMYMSEHDAYTIRPLSDLGLLISHNTMNLAWFIPELLLAKQINVAADIFSESNIARLAAERQQVNGADCYVLSGDATIRL